MVLCWLRRDASGAEWSRSFAGIACRSTQPPAPRPVVVEVRTSVYSPTEVAEAADRVEMALATAQRQPDGSPPEDVVQVTAALTFPVSIETIEEGSPERAEFETGFRASMAAELGGVRTDAIVVQGISGGSVYDKTALQQLC